MANKRIIELQERTQLDMNDYLIVDSSTSTRKLAMSTLFNYMTLSQMIFVTELPTEDISTSTIYLVPHSGSNTQWDEYVYRENAWVLIGTSTIDLSAIYQTNDKAAIQNNDIPWYGTSSTAAATTAKIATTTDTNLGALAAGQKVTIKFTYANTASAPTLNVDSKGAKPIKAYGTTTPTVWWNAGDVVTFTYDGTNWIMGATSGQIEQLKSALTPITITPVAGSGVTIAENNSVIIGNIAYIALRLAFDPALTTAYKDIITGLPTSNQDVSLNAEIYGLELVKRANGSLAARTFTSYQTNNAVISGCYLIN